jgi:hypothetical protein
MLVVSDTSDRIPLDQQPSLARCFVGVSDSTITSFSWLLIEIDTAKNSRRKVGHKSSSDGEQISRAMDQLERLHRQRRRRTGGSVPLTSNSSGRTGIEAF